MSDIKFGAHVRPGPSGSFLCVITKEKDKTLRVVQVGIEYSAQDAVQWGATTIAMIRSTGNDQSHEPDFMERNNMRKLAIHIT